GGGAVERAVRGRSRSGSGLLRRCRRRLAGGPGRRGPDRDDLRRAPGARDLRRRAGRAGGCQAERRGDPERPGAGHAAGSRRMTTRRLGWLAMVLVLVGAFAVGVLDDGGPSTPEERAQTLTASLVSPPSRGQ